MAEYLKWDETGTKTYETGTKKGVLYVQKNDGTYGDGIAWSGLTGVSESPTGADANDFWADDTKFLSLRAAEDFGFSITAYMYPEEFGECDGSAEPEPGLKLFAQTRKAFGLCYRTVIGNDIAYNDYGYKLHLIYGATCSPSDRSYTTVNDSPEPIEFSWECSTVPVNVTGYKPTAIVMLDSTKVPAEKMAKIEEILYGKAAEGEGSEAVKPRLPLPDELISILKEAA